MLAVPHRGVRDGYLERFRIYNELGDGEYKFVVVERVARAKREARVGPAGKCGFVTYGNHAAGL